MSEFADYINETPEDFPYQNEVPTFYDIDAADVTAPHGMEYIIEEGYGHEDRRTLTDVLKSETRLGTTFVNENGGDYITVEPGTKGRIGVFGLFSGTAVGVVAEFPDGSRRAHIQHCGYVRTNRDVAPALPVEQMLVSEATAGNYRDALRIDAAIMTPGSYELGPDGRYTLVASGAVHTERLQQVLQTNFGDRVNITVSPYEYEGEDESAYQQSLIINLPANAASEIFPGYRRIRCEDDV